MFSFFHKKKPTNDGQGDSGSPGSTSDFVVVNPKEDEEEATTPSSRPLYPPIQPGSAMPALPTPKHKDVHFLQGVPFKLSKEFSPNTSNDIIAMQTSEIMAYCTRNLQIDNFNYDFSVEKSVI